MDREHGVALDARQGVVHRDGIHGQLTHPLDEHERRVALVEMPRLRLELERAQGAHAAHAQDHLLVQAHLAAADVQDVRDRAVGSVVVGYVGVEQQERHTADLREPHRAPHRPAGHLDADRQRPAVARCHAGQRQALRVVVGVSVLLVAVRVDRLAEIAVAVEQANAHERDRHVRSGLQMVAGEHAQAARIDAERLVEAVFSTEVGDGMFELAPVLALEPVARAVFHVAVKVVEQRPVLGHEVDVIKDGRPVAHLLQDGDRVAVAQPSGDVDAPKQDPNARMPHPVVVVGEALESFELRGKAEPCRWQGRYFDPSGHYGGHATSSPKARSNARTARQETFAVARSCAAQTRLRSTQMRIAMVTSECEPYAKTGGLADVVDALARALGQAGHEVDVYLPRYMGLNPSEPAERLDLSVPLGGGATADVTLWTAAGRGYRLRLVDHAPSFDRVEYYVSGGVDFPDNGLRFTILARAALEAMRAENRPVDIIHCHDWEGAPAILLSRFVYDRDPVVSRPATVMSCHNLAYHGWVPRAQVAKQLGLPATVGKHDGVDLLREGILAADMVNTVSPGFARESLTPELGAGVDDALRSLGDRYLGIINGIDTELWNPATDSQIPARYSAADLAGKAACRAALCTELGLDPSGPLFAMVGRLDPQKGFDLVAGAAGDLIADGARICVLGTGDQRLIEDLDDLAESSSGRGRLAVAARFDRGLARRMYAGADAFLMPSRFEPCGQGQMISLRYGTLPVVRATGGLRDTVVDADADPDNGTGFVFGPAQPVALAEACRRAMDVLSDEPRRRAIQQRGMAVDFSWRGPARDYAAMYRRAIDISSAGR